MSGNREGGMKTREKLLASDPDYYKRMGSLGGRKSRGGGFASSKLDKNGMTGRDRARLYGKEGGRVSRRTGIRNTDKTDHVYESMLDQQ